MGVPFRSQGWVLAGLDQQNRELSAGYSQACRDTARTDRSCGADLPSRIFGSAAAQHEEEAATIRRNALTEEPAGESILAPSEDKVKPRRSEVGGPGRAGASRTPSLAPTSAVWRGLGMR